MSAECDESCACRTSPETRSVFVMSLPSRSLEDCRWVPRKSRWLERNLPRKPTTPSIDPGRFWEHLRRISASNAAPTRPHMFLHRWTRPTRVDIRSRPHNTVQSPIQRRLSAIGRPDEESTIPAPCICACGLRLPSGLRRIRLQLVSPLYRMKLFRW